VFTLESCLFVVISGFISSRIKAFRDKTMTRQGHQLLKEDGTAINNLDWAGRRFRQMSLLKSPGIVTGKGQHS
jgi:hypothetical protein